MSSAKFAARRRGFTLIELLIVIVVIAILSLIVIPKLMGASRKAKDSTVKANLQTIRNAVEMFQADTGKYPQNLDQLCLASGTTPKDTTGANIPASTYKGPYLKAEGAVIGSSAIPANPYNTTTTVGNHWTYSVVSNVGFVIPKMDDGAVDADGKTYASY